VKGTSKILLEAYGEELAWHLGELLLHLSVARGLRLRDGFRYSPDPRVIPFSCETTTGKAQALWREARGAWQALSADLPPSFSDALNASLHRPEGFWSDPFRLATASVLLLPSNPLARITLAANHLRKGEPNPAEEHLREALDSSFDPRHRSRALRNLAAVQEMKGDGEAAVGMATEAFLCAPEDPIALHDLTSYARTHGLSHQLEVLPSLNRN